MESYITLGFNILLAVLIGFGIIWGLIRGAKRTAGRLLFIIITAVIALLIAVPITKLILNIPITMQTTVGDEVTTEKISLMGYLGKLIEGYLGQEFATNYPSFVELIVSFGIILCNAFIYLILFWLLKYLLLPFDKLIYRLTIGRRKKQKEEVMAFSAFNDGETPSQPLNNAKPEYNNSDASITPLSNIMEQSQSTPQQRAPEPTNNTNPQPAFVMDDDSGATPVDKPHKAPKGKKEKAPKVKEKKHHLLGGLVGAGVGFIVLISTMIPISGLMDILRSTNNVEVINLTEDKMSLSIISDGLTDEVLNGYDQSILGKVFSTIKLDNLTLLGFDTITSTKVEGTKLSLRNEVTGLKDTVVAADNAFGLYKSYMEGDKLKSITQEQLDEVIAGVDNVLSTLKELGLVNALSEYILPIGYSYLQKNNIQFTQNAEIDQLILDTIENTLDSTGINPLEELSSLFDIAKYINTQKLLLPVVTGNYTDIIPALNNIDDDFGTKLTNTIFGIKLIDSTLPSIVNIGLKILDNSVSSFEYNEQEIEKESVKELFSSIFDSIVSVGKTLDTDSKIYVTDESLIPLGSILDAIKDSNIVNKETHDNLIDYAITQIKQRTSSVIPEQLKDYFNNKLLRNVTEVDSWENEMTAIANALNVLRNNENGILGDVAEGQESRIGYNFHFELNNDTLINIGSALDKLESSVLFGGKPNAETHENSSMLKLFASLLDYGIDMLNVDESSPLHDFISLINDMQNNLNNSTHIYDSENPKFWENEIKSVSPLITRIYDMTSGGGDIELTTQLGKDLDQAKDSTMLGNGLTLKLLDKALDIVKEPLLGSNFDPETADHSSMTYKIYTLFNGISTNLNAEETKALVTEDKFWENEIKCFTALKNIAEKASDITSIDKCLVLSSDLDSAYSSKLIPLTTLDSTIASVITQLKTTATTGIEGSINGLIDNIATDITSADFFTNHSRENFWTIELNYINDLYSIKESGFEKTNLGTIGDKFDDITTDTHLLIEGNRESYLLTKERLRNLLATGIESMSSSFTGSIADALTDIVNNLKDNSITISKFKFEMDHLSTLANIEIPSDVNALVGLGESLDEIAYNTRFSAGYTVYDENYNSKIVTRTIIADIIKSIFNEKKNASAEVGSQEETFNNLITSITTEIANKTEANYVISWARELSFVSKLMAMNDNAGFTSLASAEDIIAKNIDAIAFIYDDEDETATTYTDFVYESKDGQYAIKDYNEETNYNSAIITRATLSAAMDNMIEQLKFPGSEPDVLAKNGCIEFLGVVGGKYTNGKINNLDTLATDDSGYFNSYSEAFDAIQTNIDNLPPM